MPIEGHDKPCYYCGEPCNSVAANPGLWPVALCHPDNPGKVKQHHTHCVMERLERLATLEALWSAPLADKAVRELHDQLVEAQMWMQREEHNGSIKHDPVLSTLYGRAAGEIARLHKADEMKAVK